MYVYHAPTCTAKKIPENQRKEMYDTFKTTILMIYFYVKGSQLDAFSP